MDELILSRGDMDCIIFEIAEGFVPKVPTQNEQFALRYKAISLFADPEFETWEEFDNQMRWQNCGAADIPFDCILRFYDGNNLTVIVFDEDEDTHHVGIGGIAMNEAGRMAVEIWFDANRSRWYWFR